MASKWSPLWLSALLAGAALAIGFAWGDTEAVQWQLAARYTARVGLPVFLITYAASSLATLWPGAVTRAIVRARRQWGLGFALTHSVHLVALTLAYQLAGKAASLSTLAGGGLAYGLLYLMALTSNYASQRAMGLWWKRLHQLGIHWIWFIYTFSYVGRIFDPARQAEGLLLTGLCLAALGLRIVAWRARKRG
jgi:sulfoxide reductase heme-binding subunit YedZ